MSFDTLISTLIGLGIFVFIFAKMIRMIRAVGKMAENPEAVGEKIRRELRARGVNVDPTPGEASRGNQPTAKVTVETSRAPKPPRSEHRQQEVSTTPGFVLVLLLGIGAAAYYWISRGG